MKYIPLSQRKRAQGGDIDDIMNRLSSVESGGNYQALGPTVETGMYAGERAMGKYQVMPGNIPAWSKEALGYEVSPEDFLSNPDIQEAIVRDRISKNYAKYGNAEDVASVWFTGRPVAEVDQNVADVTGTTNSEYQRRFAMGGTPAPSAPTGMKYIPLSQRRSVV